MKKSTKKRRAKRRKKQQETLQVDQAFYDQEYRDSLTRPHDESEGSFSGVFILIFVVVGLALFVSHKERPDRGTWLRSYEAVVVDCIRKPGKPHNYARVSMGGRQRDLVIGQCFRNEKIVVDEFYGGFGRTRPNYLAVNIRKLQERRLAWQQLTPRTSGKTEKQSQHELRRKIVKLYVGRGCKQTASIKHLDIEMQQLIKKKLEACRPS